MKSNFLTVRIIKRWNRGPKDLRCSDLQSNSNYLIFFTMDDFTEGSNANIIDFWDNFLI